MNMIDSHHHLWDLKAVEYPWLNAKGVKRFFGDPTPIQRNYLIDEFRLDAQKNGFGSSVHIQVGAKDGLAEAKWVQSISDANPDWPMVQVVFCDLTSPDLETVLDSYLKLPSVRGVRQIIGRAPEEDNKTGTNDLLNSEALLRGLRSVGERGLSFDLQLIPGLMEATSKILKDAPKTKIALCHAGSPHNRTAKGLEIYAEQLCYMSSLSNVTCKLSGLGMFDHGWTTDTIKTIIDICLKQFGKNRCMFGSNFPVDKLYSSYKTLFESYKEIIPKECHETVFYKVAKDFYFY
jgi:predicted TIM-barrel fold metal-dependent hydrolase